MEKREKEVIYSVGRYEELKLTWYYVRGRDHASLYHYLLSPQVFILQVWRVV